MREVKLKGIKKIKMKKILCTILTMLLFFSCGKAERENIDIYVEKNLFLLMEELIKIYEDENDNIKINLYTDAPVVLNSFEIFISSNDNVFANIKKSDDKTKHEDIFDKAHFATDNIVVIGRKKINSLGELLYSSMAVPNYDNSVGQYFMNKLENIELFSEISKKIEYFDDSISAMQAVELSEVDYAVINTLLLDKVKNSIICYSLPKIDENTEIISYDIYLKKEASAEVQKFYNFLKSTKVENIINKKKDIS